MRSQSVVRNLVAVLEAQDPGVVHKQIEPAETSVAVATTAAAVAVSLTSPTLATTAPETACRRLGRDIEAVLVDVDCDHRGTLVDEAFTRSLVRCRTRLL